MDINGAKLISLLYTVDVQCTCKYSCSLYSNLIRGCCCCDNGLSLRAGAQPGAGVDAQRMLNKRTMISALLACT